MAIQQTEARGVKFAYWRVRSLCWHDLEKGNQAEMTSKLRQDCYSTCQMDTADPLESAKSRFERFENAFSRKPSLQACFGGHLQNLFPVPLEGSEPEAMGFLLNAIRARSADGWEWRRGGGPLFSRPANSAPLYEGSCNKRR